MSHKDLIFISSRLMIFPSLAHPPIPETYEKFCDFNYRLYCCHLDWSDRAYRHSKRNACLPKISDLANDRNPVWVNPCV